MTPRLTILLAFVSVAVFAWAPAAGAQGRKKRSKKIEVPKDPWTGGDQKKIVKAGWVTTKCDVWAPTHDPDAIRKCLVPTPVLFLETPHFRIASTLAPRKIDRKNKRHYRLLLEEFERLSKRLDKLKPKRVRTLDPWLRVHLYAQRLEELRAELVRILGKDAEKGMPKKMNVILLEQRTHLERYASQLLERPSRIAIRDCFDDGSPIFGTAAETGVLWKDRHLVGNVWFNVTHCLFNEYRRNLYELPIWFREGLAHWFAQQIDPREVNRTKGKNEEVTMLQNKDWDVLTRQLAKSNAMTPLEDMFVDTAFGKLRFRDHIACWSRIDYMIKAHPERFVKFVNGIKGQLDARGASLRGEAVMKRFGEAFQEAFETDPAGFDAQWKAWALVKRKKSGRKR